MGIRVAEYLGQRTDVDFPDIQPAVSPSECPFMNNICTKVSNRKAPVCSVRKSDGTLWITCEHRLCATKKNIPLSDYQKEILLKIGKAVFDPEVELSDIRVKREQKLQVNVGTTYKADYIMTIHDGNSPYPGPDRFVLEMQGGGETSQTGLITRHVAAWESSPDRNNQMLRTEIQGPGTIETNAWRRQQEQFIVKGNIAMKTWKGYGIVFCVGAPLFDYLMHKLEDANLPDLREYNWTLALIGISEDTSIPLVFGPIPLKADESRMLFTNYQTFVQALINQGEPSLNAFAGEFLSLDNRVIEINRNGRRIT